MKYKFIFILLISLVALNSNAQKKRTRILFIFDASNSMNTDWEGSSRISVAKKVMNVTLDSLEKIKDLELGLRMYGHQTPLRPPTPQDCNDTKLEVPIGLETAPQIKSKIKSVIPKGTTPIAISLEKAAEDFGTCEDCNNVIILITDGIEACDGDPCAIAKALREKNIKVKPFVIGVGIDLSFIDQLNCIGNTYNAYDEKSFQTILGAIVNEAMNNTTVQVDLNDEQGKPTQTNVPVTFYDKSTGRAIYHFEHTLNKKKVPDTLHIDPVYKYKMVVHTLPQIVLDNVTITPGKHNTIKVKAPMGELDLSVKNDHTNLTHIDCIVRKKDEMKTLNAQPFNLSQKYIAGFYDLEILSLPRIYMEDVEIKQNEKFTVELPHPGTLNLRIAKYSIGSIFTINDNGEYEWIYSIEEDEINQNIEMQPGNYAIVYRYKLHNQTAYSQEQKFKITSKKTTTLNL